MHTLCATVLTQPCLSTPACILWEHGNEGIIALKEGSNEDTNALGFRAKGVDAAEFEKSTGILWSSCFTDVPDDGNCLMHAIWLGLKALTDHYPHLKVLSLENLKYTTIILLILLAWPENL